MNKLLFLALFVVFSWASVHAQGGDPDSQPPVIEMKDGNPVLLNYSIPLAGISDPGMLLSHFTTRNLLVYYFSPKCPHCITGWPKIAQMAREFEASGLETIAIATGYAKKNDIRRFKEDQAMVVPLFQDVSKEFGDAYGNGHVPMVLLIGEDGRIIKLRSLSDNQLNFLKQELKKRIKG
jgi:thiol-disulfide isomerase/thioredoxin